MARSLLGDLAVYATRHGFSTEDRALITDAVSKTDLIRASNAVCHISKTAAKPKYINYKILS